MTARRRCRRCRAVLRRGNAQDLCDPCARSTRAAPDAVALPSDLYARPDVVAALAAYDFGSFFKVVRAELRLTQDEFGRLTGLAQSRICKVENGALRLRDVETIASLASTLGVPADLLGFGAAPSILDAEDGEQAVGWLQRRDFMAAVTGLALGSSTEEIWSVQRSGVLVPSRLGEPLRRVGLSDVERVEATTGVFRDWDNRWGGGLCRSAITGQLDWVLLVAKQAVPDSEDVRRRLLAAAADLASVAAWSNYDTEQHEAARGLWMVALDAAREGGNLDLAGSVLRQLVHQALHLGRPDEALRLLRLAYALAADPGHPSSDRTLALSAAYEAWCHAAAGRAGQCDRALDKANGHFDDSRNDRDLPPWLAHFDETELRALHGHTLHVLAERVPDAVPRAIPLLQEAVAHRGLEYARSRTLNLIALASTQLRYPDGVTAGVRTGYEALDGVDALNSPRARSRLRALDRSAAQRAKDPDVAGFRARLHRVLADVA
jgi:transcriptional regulator with XRE-family HTH domain